MPHTPTTYPSCDLLETLLERRLREPGNEAAVDAEIRSKFEQEKTVFVLDMSGFSRTVQRHGIIHYLAMIQRMRSVVGPAVERNGGLVVKFEADNCFAVFDEPTHAIKAIREVHAELEVFNRDTDDASDVHVSVGIGHGKILLACDDMYGNELNLASKLGEDTAEAGEVLLTEAARTRVKEYSFEEFPLTVSGVTMNAFRLVAS
jgi:class 3 adenylate cyclase